jgi:PKD repeat protein
MTVTSQATTFRIMNMRRTHQPRRLIALAGLVLASIVSGACSLDKQEMPALSGPSELALSIALAATPDQLPRDGASQSVVTVTARDAQSKPLAGQRISLSLAGGAPQGATLSQSEVVTGSSGQATFSVTAPSPGSIGDISIIASPVGTNGADSVSRLIQIRALPQNNAPPEFTCSLQSSPCAVPFSITPATFDSNTNTWGNISIGDAITFDASCSPSTTCTSRGVTDEGVPCNACTFTWNFGGEGVASGPIVRHAFGAAGRYQVTLTVTDSAGVSSVASAMLTVSAISIPTSVTVTSSPASPIATQAATFTASATPATNHRIVSYQFVWGDGGSNTQASPVIQHTYSQAGSYLLTLTVTDDLQHSTTINQVVTVTSGLTAAFTTSISGTTVTFDGSTSSSQVASTITDYAWDFTSDGSYDTNGSSSTTSNDYGASGTYRVTLKITDNRGATQTVVQNVVVP